MDDGHMMRPAGAYHVRRCGMGDEECAPPVAPQHEVGESRCARFIRDVALELAGTTLPSTR